MSFKGFIILLSIFTLSSCGKSEEEKLKIEKDLYNRCVSNGVEYFKEIGSYPTLTAPPNKNKSAITVARERCKRAPRTAFPK
ncbi:hypothetical protein [Pseudoalteromonas sp. Q18-MNA-CIBAN-0097]|uniref:hypothetical protein n=1 Tax=Pseudoalteromonas sp. Q18-MNA-CIBAN-0097 TaxID=3140440 RepID=UPI0033231157